MRIKINLFSEIKQKLDLNYNHYLSSLVYKHLELSSKDYSSMLHKQGYILHNKKFKLFTFSQLIAKTFSREGSIMILDGELTWYVSSPNKEFILYFVDSITSVSSINVGDCRLEISDISTTESIDFKRQMRFRCLSPVVVTTGEVLDQKLKPRSVSIKEKVFTDNLKNNTLKKYFLIYGTLPDDMNFNIEFMNIDKYSKGKLINFKGTFIKGYAAPFIFKGNPDLIKVAYEAGLGEKNSSGMGFIDVYNS